MKNLFLTHTKTNKKSMATQLEHDDASQDAKVVVSDISSDDDYELPDYSQWTPKQSTSSEHMLKDVSLQELLKREKEKHTNDDDDDDVGEGDQISVRIGESAIQLDDDDDDNVNNGGSDNDDDDDVDDDIPDYEQWEPSSRAVVKQETTVEVVEQHEKQQQQQHGNTVELMKHMEEKKKKKVAFVERNQQSFMSDLTDQLIGRLNKRGNP